MLKKARARSLRRKFLSRPRHLLSRFSSGGKVQFDNHGDSAQANVNYHGYGKGTKANDEGVIEAAFNGQHGWYWKNRGSESLTITLQTTGPYTEIKHLK